MVLYEDPPDQVPKIHVRSSKYMAWIAENQLPVHMHVEKGKALQFDQWRIAHLAEFGLCNFAEVSASRAPTPAQPASPSSPKAKRRRKKDRRSKPEPEPEPKPEPEPELEPEPAAEPEVTEAVNEPSPVPSPAEQGRPRVLECGHCGEMFTVLRDLTEHALYRCLPDQAFDCDRECFEFFRPAPNAGNTRAEHSVTDIGSNKVNINGEAESPSAENYLSKIRGKSETVVTKETSDADRGSVESNSAKTTKGESDILSSETLATNKISNNTADAAAEIIRVGQSEEDKPGAGSGKGDNSETGEATEAVQTGAAQASPADSGADISDTEADKENERRDTENKTALSSTRQHCHVSHD